MPVLDDVRELCALGGIPVDVLHTEPGPGMVEANLHHLPLLRATFMAQWADGHSGCGAHLHQSLWQANGTPASSKGRGRFTPRFRSYTAGMLETMAELCVLF